MMVLWDMIICAIFGFLIGYYTNALMVTRDRKELKRTFEVMLEKERKTGKWIPVKERLPKKSGTYCVYICDESYTDRTNSYMSIVYFSSVTGEFSTPSKWYKVLAWMPLPEPYYGLGQAFDPD